MGYNAFVICSCHKDGKTSIPPFKDYIVFNEDGLYIDIPSSLRKKDKKKADKVYDDFQYWRLTACEHNNMYLADEHLGNILELGSFMYAFKNLDGSIKYPILLKYLPKSNDGVLPAKYAKEALKELLLLENENMIEKFSILREKDTKEIVVAEQIDSYWHFNHTIDNEITFGIDKDGFFIIKNSKGKLKTVFRSIRFKQHQLNETLYEFIDIETNKKFESSLNFFSEQQKINNEYEVVIGNVSLKYEFYNLIEALHTLLNASIESGNPIHWS